MIEYERLTRPGQIRRLRQVAREALTGYGIEPLSLSLLAHAYHTTFTVTGPDASRYVLHILRPDRDGRLESQRRTRVESELWWLDQVRSALTIPVPSAVRTAAREGVVSVDLADGSPPRLCTLFHWIDGRFFDHRLAPTQLAAVGAVTARLHHHSSHLRVPAWFDRPRVDSADAETEEGVVSLFSGHFSPAAARVMQEVFRRVRRAKGALGNSPDSFGLIHADIHQRNYLFHHGNVQLIDFGDCGWGHYLYDLAVTLSELADLPRRASLSAAFLAGYRRVRDLSPTHETLIDTFVLLREAQNLTWFLHQRDDPSYQGRAAHIAEGVAKLERRLRAEA